MKMQLCLFMIILILIFDLSLCKKSDSNIKSTLSNNVKMNNLKQDSKELMKTMFAQPSSSECVSKSQANQIGGYMSKIRSGSNNISSRDFSWIKVNQWGYGQNSYIFDYLDPVIGDNFIKSADKIYSNVKKFDNEEYKGYKDPFISDIIDAKTGQSKKSSLPQNLENYNPEVYALSINSVQIFQSFDTYKWSHNEFSDDSALEFVQKYDINGDTRLSPRELILAIISENKGKYAKGEPCYMCFEDLIPVIDSIFSYMDCDSDGYIDVNNMLKYLKKLKRNTVKWDIFVDSELGVRNKSINDFFLVNGSSKKGELNQQEFRLGILFGYWNRQTTDKSIVTDSSKSLKDLRWADNGLIDKELARYKFQLAEKERLEKEKHLASINKDQDNAGN